MHKEIIKLDTDKALNKFDKYFEEYLRKNGYTKTFKEDYEVWVKLHNQANSLESSHKDAQAK